MNSLNLELLGVRSNNQELCCSPEIPGSWGMNSESWNPNREQEFTAGIPCPSQGIIRISIPECRWSFRLKSLIV